MIDKVKYYGDVTPVEVQNTFTKYHASVLLTKGENFGHAIIEAFSTARPVLISDNTPWQNLEQAGAGFSVPLNEDIWIKALLQMVQWDDNDFKNACSSALQYYQHKFDFSDLKRKYLRLFYS